jgi:hypothetical protein
MARADSPARDIGTYRGQAVNRWVAQLSNWQFVAVFAGITLCALVAMDCVIALITGRINLASFIFYDVVFTALSTGLQAWRRWK